MMTTMLTPTNKYAKWLTVHDPAKNTYKITEQEAQRLFDISETQGQFVDAVAKLHLSRNGNLVGFSDIIERSKGYFSRDYVGRLAIKHNITEDVAELGHAIFYPQGYHDGYEDGINGKPRNELNEKIFKSVNALYK